LKENPDDVASAVLGPDWPNPNPLLEEGPPSVVDAPILNPADVAFSAGFVAANEKPPLALSGAFVFVPKENPPVVPWLLV
jgi:hypothetical protein